MVFAPSTCNGEVPLVPVPQLLPPRCQASLVLGHHHAVTEMPGIAPSRAAPPHPCNLGSSRPQGQKGKEQSEDGRVDVT